MNMVWSCGHCGEEHETAFDACWKCGAHRETTSNEIVSSSVASEDSVIADAKESVPEMPVPKMFAELLSIQREQLATLRVIRNLMLLSFLIFIGIVGVLLFRLF